MGDEGEFWNDVRQAKREERARLGVACPECLSKLPKASPSILLPGQRRRIHGYRDPRANSKGQDE